MKPWLETETKGGNDLASMHLAPDSCTFLEAHPLQGRFVPPSHPAQQVLEGLWRQGGASSEKGLGGKGPPRLWTCLTCTPQGPAVESGGQGWGDPSRQKQEVLGGVPAGKDEATSQRTAGAQGPSKVFQLLGKLGSGIQQKARARWVAWETEELPSPGKPEEAILSPVPTRAGAF